jgi:hypothetical protein
MMRPPGAITLLLLLAVCTGAASAQSSSCAQDVGRDFLAASLTSKNMSPAPLVDVLRRRPPCRKKIIRKLAVKREVCRQYGSLRHTHICRVNTHLSS